MCGRYLDSLEGNACVCIQLMIETVIQCSCRSFLFSKSLSIGAHDSAGALVFLTLLNVVRVWIGRGIQCACVNVIGVFEHPGNCVCVHILRSLAKSERRSFVTKVNSLNMLLKLACSE